MTSRDFCYWLQGYFEIHGEPAETMTAERVAMVKRHLALVFKHEIDPSIAKPGTPEAKALDVLHSGLKPEPPKFCHKLSDFDPPHDPGLIRC